MARVNGAPKNGACHCQRPIHQGMSAAARQGARMKKSAEPKTALDLRMRRLPRLVACRPADRIGRRPSRGIAIRLAARHGEQPHGRYLLVKYGLILARSKSAFPEACPCLIALTGITAAKHTPQCFLPDFPLDLAPSPAMKRVPSPSQARRHIRRRRHGLTPHVRGIMPLLQCRRRRSCHVNLLSITCDFGACAEGLWWSAPGTWRKQTCKQRSHVEAVTRS